MIKEAFFEAWKKFKLYLIIPDLTIVLFSLITVLYFSLYKGFINQENLMALVSSNLPDFGNFLINNALTVLSIILVLVFINYFLGTGILAMKYGMFKDLLNKKEFNIRTSLSYSTEYFWKVFLLRIFIGIFATIALLVSLIVLLLIAKYNSRVAGLTALIVFLLLVALIKLGVMFRYAIMFFKNKKAFDAIKESLHYLIKKPGFLINIFLVISFVGFLMNGVAIAIDFIFSYVFGFFGNTIMLMLQGLTRIILYLIFVVWSDIFIFVLYMKIKP